MRIINVNPASENASPVFVNWLNGNKNNKRCYPGLITIILKKIHHSGCRIRWELDENEEVKYHVYFSIMEDILHANACKDKLGVF